MYVKNVSQILKANLPLTTKLFEGSTISGKVLLNENNKGTLKLYDGTIIPAIFISENDMDMSKYNRFVIRGFDGENFVLKLLGESSDPQKEKSLTTIVRDLNIPAEDGKKIIMNLIKYNLPATNENINTMYKSLSFINNIKNMTEDDILLFLKNQLNENITQDSNEFKISKEMFSSLKKVDIDFLSFLLENDMTHTPDNIMKTQDFINNKFFINTFIDSMKNSKNALKDELNKKFDNLQNSIEPNDINPSKPPSNETQEVKLDKNPSQEVNTKAPPLEKDSNSPMSKLGKLFDAKPSNAEKLIINSILNNLSESIKGSKNKLSVTTLEETIEIFKNNKDSFSFSSTESYKKLMNNLEILKKLDDNYSMYFFNLYNTNNIFKNNIIIKHKYKGSKYIDINDVKAFLTVDTSALGTVEGNLYKKNDDISIAFSVNKEHVDLFKNNTNELKKILKDYGYNFVNISVEPHAKDKSFPPFSDFFNESILRELDVKV